MRTALILSSRRPDMDGIYGRFTIDADGAWTYTLDNDDDDTNALAAGDTPEDPFTVRASADNSVTQLVTITVNGANDAPMAVISTPQANAQVAFGVAFGQQLTLTGQHQQRPGHRRQGRAELLVDNRPSGHRQFCPLTPPPTPSGPHRTAPRPSRCS